MNTAAQWLRGGIAALALVAPATGQPAVNAAIVASSAGGMKWEPELAIAPRVERPREDDPFPGKTYGDLDDDACLRALDDRGIDYERLKHAHGVATPVHLMGELHGVRFVHADMTDWQESAEREILDCRLVLALDDLARYVAQRDVVTVFHFGVYRGDLPLPKTGRPLHHVAALAIDVAAFEKRDGTRLDVRRDWRGKSERREELRGLLGDIAEAKLFHQVLTPNHNEAHRDHFHLEVMRGTSWTMVD